MQKRKPIADLRRGRKEPPFGRYYVATPLRGADRAVRRAAPAVEFLAQPVFNTAGLFMSEAPFVIAATTCVFFDERFATMVSDGLTASGMCAIVALATSAATNIGFRFAGGRTNEGEDYLYISNPVRSRSSYVGCDWRETARLVGDRCRARARGAFEFTRNNFTQSLMWGLVGATYGLVEATINSALYNYASPTVVPRTAVTCAFVTSLARFGVHMFRDLKHLRKDVLRLPASPQQALEPAPRIEAAARGNLVTRRNWWRKPAP